MSANLSVNVRNRNAMIRELRRELMGPYPGSAPVSVAGSLVFSDFNDYRKAHFASGTRQEVLTGNSPRQRYGIGVLYPAETPAELPDEPGEPSQAEDGEQANGLAEETLTEAANAKLEQAIEKIASDNSERETEDFDITLTNLSRPRSMGISFLAEIPPNGQLRVHAKGGRYVPIEAVLEKAAGKKPRLAWYRRPVNFVATFDCATLLASPDSLLPVEVSGTGFHELNLRIEIFARPFQTGETGNTRLLTVCLVNRTRFEAGAGCSLDACCLFQSRFSLEINDGLRSDFILPYPDAGLREPDEEEKSYALLYRHARTFATGHGCAPDWCAASGGIRATRLKAVPFPVFETPSITPDVFRADGSMVAVPMAPLAGIIAGNDGAAALREVVDLYGAWIQKKEAELPFLSAEERATGQAHLDLCRKCHCRMLAGLGFLQHDPKAARAFALANHAILLQQIRSFRESRKADISPNLRLVFQPPMPAPDPLKPGSGRGTWRPFQIAFLLMCLESAARGEGPDRETVELIWFPTGGGKTEAYLGLAAFAIFYRRLAMTGDTGTHALMRYTLRLLTAQQFQRASGLICAMEHLRRSHAKELGAAEFSIGIWLGGDTTPNDRTEALRHYRALVQGREKEDYAFVLLRCPWCGCQIGPLQDPLLDPAKKPKAAGKWKKSKPDPSAKHLLGLKQSANTVQLHCPDGQCEFHRSLPVYVVDEDIYGTPPDLIIGTVDKFAALAWKPEARSIFGIGTDGNRKTSPPGLIIQDELHLITGPLGSMVGLYETVIQDLCTDYRGVKPVLPKIVSSTATTRRYKEQVRGLYARNEVVLFPPPGLEAGDSFFAAYARDDRGRLRRGRAYVGVFAGAYSSGLTTNVKVFSSLLQTPMSMEEDAVDPWYTLLIFYNSLRELGANLTLFQADIPEKLYNLFSERYRKDTSAESKSGNRRYLNDILELTGRISSGEVPLALQELERCATTKLHPKATDVCLASNIIEVGVDVDRLSVMAVNGQPKTTAQYIQVTGRVGRKWAERPGLVVTVYTPNKPRDRSHFERFRTYHERLYAQVEPACVTPFTTPALERALHAVMVAYVRQQGRLPDVDKPSPVPSALLEKIVALVRRRQAAVAPDETNALEQQLARRLSEWSAWGRREWRNASDSTDPSLLRNAGAYYPAAWSAVSWATPTSMRNVDAECQPEVTLLYAAAAALAAAPAAPAPRPVTPAVPGETSTEPAAQPGI